MEIKKLVNRFTNTADRQFASILDEFGALVKFLEDQVNSDTREDIETAEEI